MTASVISVFTVTLVLDFAVPYSYYLYVTQLKGRTFDPHRAINSYYSGMIGDTLCAPAINTLLFLTYSKLILPFRVPTILACLFSGLLITVFLHTAQAKIKMTNWSMPEPWRWTFPGKYHIFSATLQFAFLIFSLFSVYLNWNLISQSSARLSYFLGTIFFVLLFLMTFVRDTYFFKAEPVEEPAKF